MAFFLKKLQEIPSGWELRSQARSANLFSRTKSSEQTTFKILLHGFE